MREFVTREVVENWVSMLRADVDGAIWLCDDDEDARFYERCAHETSRIVPAGGQALALLDEVKRRGIAGVVAAIRQAEGNPQEGIFCPDIGDVASVLLLSSTSDRTIVDVTGAPWAAACGKIAGSARVRAISIAKAIEHLRQGSTGERAPDLSITRTINELICWDTFQLRWNRINECLRDHSEAKRFLDEARSAPEDEDPRMSLSKCDGRDVVELLSAATRHFRPRGINAVTQVGPRELMRLLRVGYDMEELTADGVFHRMRRWERQHQGYPLLKEWRLRDPLGVVLDQRYWEQDLKVQFALTKSGQRLAALKMDLDNFKAVNEKLGHSMGDEAIRLYCTMVRENLGPYAEVYRRGGDEVVVLAPGLSGPEAAELAERLRQRIESDFREWGTRHRLEACPTASIGVVSMDLCPSAEDAVKLLDQAQKLAKETGKNRVVHLKDS